MLSNQQTRTYSRWTLALICLSIISIITQGCVPTTAAPTVTAIPAATQLFSPSPIPQTQSPAPTNKPSDIPAQTDTPRAAILTPTNLPPYLFVKLDPANGSLESQLPNQIKTAESLGLKPYIDWYALWCSSCMKLARGIALQNPLLVDAFSGTYIMEMNVDEAWDWDAVRSLGYDSDFIPVLFEVGTDGRATGRQIDGGAWGEDIPENMAPALKSFFDGS